MNTDNFTIFDINLPQVYHDPDMKIKAIITLTISLALFLYLPNLVFAKKKLQRIKKPEPINKEHGAWVKPKLRSDGKALLLMLGGMKHADSIDYTLTYNSGPVPQGIQSYHTPEDGNTQKELVFGTCSGQDCVYHGNLTEMILEIKIALKSGQTLTQRYQINP